MSRRSIPRTPKKVKRISKSKTRKKSPAKRAKPATKKRKSKPKKAAKRIRVSAKPVKKTVKKAVKRTVKKAAPKKRPSMNIHTPKKSKKAVKKTVKRKPVKRRVKTAREKKLEREVDMLRELIPQALIHNIIGEAEPPKFAPLQDKITDEQLESVQRILKEDLVPEPDSEHEFIPLQPSIMDNLAPGTQRAITQVKLNGIRLKRLPAEALEFWAEHRKTARMIVDVTDIWDEGGNEREYMEQLAEKQGKRTRALYTELLSPGELEDVFADPDAAAE